MLGLRVRPSAGRDWAGCWRHSVGGTYGRALCNGNGQSARVAQQRAPGSLSRFGCEQTARQQTDGANGQVDDAAARRGPCRKETKRLGLDGSEANEGRAPKPNNLSDGRRGARWDECTPGRAGRDQTAVIDALCSYMQRTGAVKTARPRRRGRECERVLLGGMPIITLVVPSWKGHTRVHLRPRTWRDAIPTRTYPCVPPATCIHTRHHLIRRAINSSKAGRGRSAGRALYARGRID